MSLEAENRKYDTRKVSGCREVRGEGVVGGSWLGTGHHKKGKDVVWNRMLRNAYAHTNNFVYISIMSWHSGYTCISSYGLYYTHHYFIAWLWWAPLPVVCPSLLSVHWPGKHGWAVCMGETTSPQHTHVHVHVYYVYTYNTWPHFSPHKIIMWYRKLTDYSTHLAITTSISTSKPTVDLLYV